MQGKRPLITRDNPFMSPHEDRSSRSVLNGLARAFVLPGLMAMAACNPTLNWREARVNATGLVVMLPCKPAHQTRAVALGGQTLDMHMSACDAGGATFAIAHVAAPQADAAPALLSQWRKVTLANLGAQNIAESAVRIDWGAAQEPGQSAQAGTNPGSLRVSATAKRADGSLLHFQGVWFSARGQAFQAAIYAPQISPEMTENFLAGLKYQ